MIYFIILLASSILAQILFMFWNSYMSFVRFYFCWLNIFVGFYKWPICWKFILINNVILWVYLMYIHRTLLKYLAWHFDHLSKFNFITMFNMKIASITLWHDMLLGIKSNLQGSSTWTCYLEVSIWIMISIRSNNGYIDNNLRKRKH